MPKIPTSEKNKVLQKMLQFQKSGLEQYGKYLSAQLAYANKSPLRALYKKYIETQIELNDKKIKSVTTKLEAL